jgi:hypothetical protein
MGKNPFGDDSAGPQRTNPFGDEETNLSAAEAAYRIEQAALKIRNLRRQLASDGLTLPATRELIDELAAALEATAKAFRQIRS